MNIKWISCPLAGIYTQHGPDSICMYPYAYIGHGKTINSAGQLQYFKCDISDIFMKLPGEL